MSEINDSTTEIELMKKLNIDSWRNLSKDKVLEFASALPDLDKEVALQVVGQFPNLKELVNGALQQVENQAKEAHRFNWRSQKKAHEGYADYRRVLDRELDRDDQSPEARLHILELFKKVVDDEAAKDSENKKFLAFLATTGSAAIVVAIGLASAALGGSSNLRDHNQN
ncbi:hypothetical protein [Aestuariimicrobium kwangyangense]|uniref:hypothetical protein n=1 Tax=Aestuariimicrobium kwangyangense TaxID=396389 RepID=UPI0003B5F876|nr:hypothetical protein [Aestuariimicrobium kwangyangense]